MEAARACLVRAGFARIPVVRPTTFEPAVLRNRWMATGWHREVDESRDFLSRFAMAATAVKRDLDCRAPPFSHGPSVLPNAIRANSHPRSSGRSAYLSAHYAQSVLSAIHSGGRRAGRACAGCNSRSEERVHVAHARKQSGVQRSQIPVRTLPSSNEPSITDHRRVAVHEVAAHIAPRYGFTTSRASSSTRRASDFVHGHILSASQTSPVHRMKTFRYRRSSGRSLRLPRSGMRRFAHRS